MGAGERDLGRVGGALGSNHLRWCCSIKAQQEVECTCTQAHVHSLSENPLMKPARRPEKNL